MRLEYPRWRFRYSFRMFDEESYVKAQDSGKLRTHWKWVIMASKRMIRAQHEAFRIQFTDSEIGKLHTQDWGCCTMAGLIQVEVFHPPFLKQILLLYCTGSWCKSWYGCPVHIWKKHNIVVLINWAVSWKSSPQAAHPLWQCLKDWSKQVLGVKACQSYS